MNMDIETLKKKLLRKGEIINNFLGWVVEHDTEFIECAINAMNLTPEEIDEYDLKEYLEKDDEDDEYNNKDYVTIKEVYLEEREYGVFICDFGDYKHDLKVIADVIGVKMVENEEEKLVFKNEKDELRVKEALKYYYELHGC